MKSPEQLRFTREHEWVRIEDDHATIGITDHAQDALGDIVYVELPEVGEVFDQDDVFGVVESVKTTSDLYSPIGGTIAEINEALVENSGLVNDDCYGEGWLIRIKLKDPAETEKLMTAAQYDLFAAEESE